jgi:hypothetical protein
VTEHENQQSGPQVGAAMRLQLSREASAHG